MNIRKLHPQTQKVALDEVNEVPERIAPDLQMLKEWISKQPHLTARMDDQWLIAFLRGCKYSIEKAKEKIDNFYTFKHIVPELCFDLDPMKPDNKFLIDSGVLLKLGSIYGPGSPHVFMIRPGVMDPSKISILNYYKVNYMNSITQMMINDDFTICGSHLIIDMEGVSMEIIMNITPVMAKKLISLFQNAFPVRSKMTHCINASPIMEGIIKLFQSLLNEESLARFYVFTKENTSDMFEHLPKRILPTEYGGQNGSIQEKIEDLRAMLIENREFLVMEDNYRTDEKKRLGSPKFDENIFGVEGTFRKLNFD